MIKITNGSVICEVSKGAFDEIYSKQGFRPLVNKNIAKRVESDSSVKNEPSANTPDDKFLEEIQEKPIANWKKEEVKKFASLKGIDISGTKNANEAKTIIKNFLAEEESNDADEVEE